MRPVRLVAAVAAPVVVVLAAKPLTVALGGPTGLPVAITNYTEVVVAGTAAALFWLRSRQERKADVRHRGALVMAFACLAWCAGQTVWTVYEVLLQRPSPTPSLADVGFLAFYLSAPVGVVLLAHNRLQGGRARVVADGLVVAGALLVVSWTLVLSPMVQSASQDALLLILHLAYPLADVFVLSVAVVVMSRTQADQRTILLTTGAASLALSDSSFILMSLKGTFATGGLPDVGWTAGLTALALAAVTPDGFTALHSESVSDRLPFVLPYVPASIAGVVVVFEAWRGDTDAFAMTLMLAVGVGVLSRQALLVRDNMRLLGQLSDRGRQLLHMAYTDPLTDTGNRLAFNERLRLFDAPTPSAMAALCDLDSFKAVNDRCGHATGDAVLKVVAHRLMAVIRSDDLVARLGGDEFGVLASSSAFGGEEALRDRDELANRLRVALAPPYSQDAEIVAMGLSASDRLVVDAVTVSVGVVHSSEVQGGEQALVRADERMYVAKQARCNPSVDKTRKGPSPISSAVRR